MTSGPIVSFRDLDAWMVAMDLSLLAYDVAKRLPKSELFELSSQMRRAAVSVPANVAEGHAYGTPARCVHHVRIALGSLGELDTHFEIALRLRYVQETDLEKALRQLSRTRQLLHGLLRAKQLQRLKDAGTALALLMTFPLGWLLGSILG